MLKLHQKKFNSLDRWRIESSHLLVEYQMSFNENGILQSLTKQNTGVRRGGGGQGDQKIGGKIAQRLKK
jgi:hypothetical protein